ncbi:MAG: hypothetical protein OXH79_03000 [Boseongicola sp.]|nr:hypothetical protein [Boseongicola sp.]
MFLARTSGILSRETIALSSVTLSSYLAVDRHANERDIREEHDIGQRAVFDFVELGHDSGHYKVST